MQLMIPWAAANAGTLLLLACVFGYLYFRDRRASLRLWALAWLVASVAQIVTVRDMVSGPSWGGAISLGLLGIALSVLYLAAAYALAERRVPRVWIAVAGFAAAWTITAPLLDLAITTALAPILVVIGTTLIAAGVIIVRSDPREAGAWVAGVGQILVGVHTMDFPIVSQYPALLPWGYLLAIMFTIVMSIGILMLHYDSARRELLATQHALADARRSEAVGRLAGGVAHDFNNLLTVIRGNLEFVRRDLREPSRIEESVQAMERAAEQATRLTRQLLAFGRRNLLQPETLDVVEVVDSAAAMFRRVLPENVDLRVDKRVEQLRATVDRTALEQILLNLVTNARDAMPMGGRLSITLDATTESGGPFVSLSVRDQGRGMDDATAARAFEPFFTTKEMGRGTGLGLATVHGIVSQLGGSIRLETAPGQGACVHVRIPVGESVSGEEHLPPVVTSSQVGRILVVEDESAVRSVACQVLRAAGHQVEESPDGRAALDRIERGEIYDAVVTDIVMPELGGIELMDRIAQLAPQTQVLLTSGYPEGAREPVPAGARARLLPKPYTSRDLVEAVAAILRRPRRTQD